jgi:HAD superfamily hydrolase (TIGR01509 family)
VTWVEPETPVAAVVFDLDGVLLDSLGVWESVLSDFVRSHGAEWGALVEDSIVGGDNSLEWADYLRRRYLLTPPPREIIDEVVRQLLARYAAALPLMPGARGAVARLRTRFRLGVASSSHPELIRFALEASGLAPFFDARVSSDDVGGGKPKPDVYLRACQLLGVPPTRAVAVEDSPGGLMAAHAAGMGAIAFPGPAFVLPPEVLRLAGATIGSLTQLTPEVVLSARRWPEQV